MISLGKGKSCGLGRLNHFICKIRDLTREVKVNARHIPRGQNALADKLAKWNFSQQTGYTKDHCRTFSFLLFVCFWVVASSYLPMVACIPLFFLSFFLNK